MPWSLFHFSRKRDRKEKSNPDSKESRELRGRGWVTDPHKVGWGNRRAHHDMRPRLGSKAMKSYRNKRR